MFQIANLLLHSPDIAEDAVHDAFLKIIQHFEELEHIPQQKQEAWVVTILKNTCLDILRREKKRISQDVAALLVGLPDLRLDVEADVNYRLLRDAMGKLSADDRELLELKLVLGWSDKEIGQSLMISANAAAVRVHRARQRLQDLLRQEGWHE